VQSIRLLLLAFLFFSFSAFAASNLVPTTTLQAETSVNTSANISGLPNGAVSGNVNKASIRNLLYPGSTTQIYAAFQPWFGPPNHISVGYNSADPAQVKRQVEDMISRGIQGAIVDWYGTSDSFIDGATQQLRAQAEAHPGFQIALMYDGGALLTAAMQNGCDATNQAIRDLTLGYNEYMNSPAYTRIDGRPVVYFFGTEAWYIDWNIVRASVPGNPILLFQGTGGYTETSQSNGAYQWIEIINGNQFDPQIAALQMFYAVAVDRPQQPATGSAYKGFNDVSAIWSTNRIVNQHCGQTWIDTFNTANRFYSSSNQLPALQVVTWNDYEEGSEIETGIDDCIVISPALVGGWLTWNVTGNENAVDHYTLFASTDGQNLEKLVDLPTSRHAIDMGVFGLSPANYILYVQAVGKPSIINHMSPAVGYLPGDQSPALVTNVDTSGGMTVTVTLNATDPDGTVTSSQIDFGDGTVVSGSKSSHTYASVGSYEVRATAFDNLGAFNSSAQRITAKPAAPAITVTAPSNGAVQNYPNPFIISANSAAPVTTMAVYIGNQLAYLTDHDFINTPLKVFKGNQRITVQAWDANGAMQSTQFTVNAEPQDIPATAVVTAVPFPKVSPLAVIACTANSFDPDGFILQANIGFSDGFSTVNRTAVHILPGAGTWSVNAAVIDQFGAGSTAQATVKVP